MSTLPIDRTNLNLAITNQVPSQLIQSAKNINAISTLYDGSDALYNYVLAVVAAYTAAGGAASIGTSPITGITKTNVQAVLAEIEAQVLAIVAGAIPTNSITTAMIQDLAITAAKIANGAVGMNQLAAAVTSQIYALDRQVALLTAFSTLTNRTDQAPSNFFFDLMDGLNNGSNGKIDNTKTNSTGTIPISAVTIVVPVLATSGFAVGQEVTIFDDVSLERRIITAINAGVSLSFAAMTNSYKIKAQICRSSVIQDTVNKLLKFNGWSNFTTNTAVNVVALAYDTSGNNGDKLVQTANGNFITIEVNGTTIQVQKSIDGGKTYADLCNITGAQVGAAIAAYNNTVTILWNSTTVAYSNTFDVTTVTNVDQNPNKVTLPGTFTAISNNVSISVKSTGIMCAAVSTKTAGLPNSFNVLEFESTTSAVTAWAASSALTADNTAGTDSINAVIKVKSNNNAIVNYQRTTSTTWSILSQFYNGSAWIAATTSPYPAAVTYSQSNPCVRVAPSGRIWCVWHGLDATDSSTLNIRYSYSDDGGATWLTAVKLTSGNTYVQQISSLSIDKNNNVYVLWQGYDVASPSFQNIFRNVWTGTAFQGVTKLTTNTTAAAFNVSSIDNNTMDFNLLTPPMIYRDNQVVAVKFSGTVGTSTPVLVEDVRYNINPPANVSTAVAWVDHDADPNYSIAGAVSFQAGGGNESFANMTKTTAAIDGTHNEDQFKLEGAAAAKATLRLTLTRNSTSLVKNISQIFGAVGV